MNDEVFDQLLLGIAEKGILADPEKADVPLKVGLKRKVKKFIRGKTQIGGNTVTVGIGLTASFPLDLPILVLEPWNDLGFIPHIENDGYICYASSEGLALDSKRPLDILEEAVTRAKKTLEDGILEKNHGDFIEEFESYWANIEKSERAKSFLRLVPKVERISIGTRNDDHNFFCDHEGNYVRECFNGYYPEKTTLQNALYIPFKSPLQLSPPAFDQMWNLPEIRKIILENLDSAEHKHLVKILRKHRNNEYVVLHFKTQKGTEQLFGIAFRGVEKAHPLLPAGSCREIIPIVLDRMDKQYLLPRAGGDNVLSGKKVVLIGCGAVGGHIAMELARCGVGHMTLVDHDDLSPDNIYRHVLGWQDAEQKEKKKVKLLKHEIESKVPYVQVTAVGEKIEELFEKKEMDLHDYDLVVVAIGNPQVELQINEVLCSSDGMPAGLFAWLEPYGIGGHASVSHNAKKSGCLRCLFPETEEMHNLASFAKKDQSFSKNLTGCSNRFMPFASIHAVRTATLATELAVNILTGKEPDNPCLSWKGDATEFLAQKFKLTHRHAMTEGDLYDGRYDYKRADCSVCNKQHE